MIIKLLTEHHLEFLSFKGGCRGSSESTLVKMSNCWKSHAGAHTNGSWVIARHKETHERCLTECAQLSSGEYHLLAYQSATTAINMLISLARGS